VPRSRGLLELLTSCLRSSHSIPPDRNAVTMVETIPLLLPTPVVSSETFPVYSPATGKTIYHASAATREHAETALDVTAAAYKTYKHTPLTRRRDLLDRYADLLEQSAGEMIRAICEETGCAKSWAELNMNIAVNIVRGVAARVVMLAGVVPECEDPDTTAIVQREPLGVILSIAPWNAPVILAVRAIVNPLAAGNTVILKTSELSPRTHHLLAELVTQAGFPDGVVTTLGQTRDGAAALMRVLVEAPCVRKVNFTGSTSVGRKIAALCGENLKPCLLELGGNAPMLVFEDADLRKAAGAAAFGAFHHAGQICMSCQRLLVHRSVAAEFLQELKMAAKNMYGTRQVMTQMRGSEMVADLVKEAEGKGAVVHLHPESPAEELRATEHRNVIITGGKTDMELWRVESFGPVLLIVEFDTEEEAVEMANDTDYGLNAAVWTRNVMRGLRVGKQIECGNCHVNGATIHDEVALPHGGVKNSGFGRFNGMWGIEEFTTIKTITLKE
jgi:acyl-CoA reductase-like NAD-dependent aldehyde dehydrogenase